MMEKTDKIEIIRGNTSYLECLVDDGTYRLTPRGTGTLCFEPVT